MSTPAPLLSARLAAALSAALLLAGCLATDDRRVMVRRDPNVVAERERLKNTNYEEYLIQLSEQSMARELTAELRASEQHYALTRKHVRAALADLPREPDDVYEEDRARVLYRPWSDVGPALPEPEPEPEPEPAEEPAEEPAPEDDSDGGDEDSPWGGDDW